MGTLDMLSTPPARKRSPWFVMMARAAMSMVSWLLPQKRLMVAAPAVMGRPARKLMRRAMFMPCSPSGMAQPTSTSSRPDQSFSRGLRASITTEPSCSGRVAA